ncbi:UAA transporter family-domain-containing protein [Zopfochytrium polystomum]|nr:UAA transporter family-domain-containing protein [Zopfochytrium polystomum]
MNRYVELAIVVAGIYTFFLTWGITQERVTTTAYGGAKFRYFIFMNFVQAVLASTVAFIYLKLRRFPANFPRGAMVFSFAQLSLYSVLASPFGYASLKYIDYPTMILGKSCKLVPVLLMNVLLYRKSFPLYKYVIVALITAGVSAFMLLHPSDKAKHKRAAAAAASRTLLESLWGLLLLSINLLLDGVTNSTQDKIFHENRSLTGAHMMLHMNLGASVLMAGYLVASNPFTGELAASIAFCARHTQVVWDLLLFGLCGAVGQCFIFHSLERFGAVTTVTITVTRKMMSIVLSVLLYNHQLAFGQWVAVGVVFVGIGLEAFWKGGHGHGAKKGKDAKKAKAEAEEEEEEVVVDLKRVAGQSGGGGGGSEKPPSQEWTARKDGPQRRRAGGRSKRED